MVRHYAGGIPWANKIRKLCYAQFVPELRSCVVTYQDTEGVKHSVEVTAESLYEAAILGMKALKAAEP